MSPREVYDEAPRRGPGRPRRTDYDEPPRRGPGRPRTRPYEDDEYERPRRARRVADEAPRRGPGRPAKVAAEAPRPRGRPKTLAPATVEKVAAKRGRPRKVAVEDATACDGPVKVSKNGAHCFETEMLKIAAEFRDTFIPLVAQLNWCVANLNQLIPGHNSLVSRVNTLEGKEDNGQVIAFAPPAAEAPKAVNGNGVAHAEPEAEIEVDEAPAHEMVAEAAPSSGEEQTDFGF